MPFIESRREYIERQACEYVRVSQDDLEAMAPAEVRSAGLEEGTFLFANGARCNVDGFDRLSRLGEPPTEHFSLIRATRTYLMVKLAREVSRWKQFKGQCDEQIAIIRQYGPYTPPPPADAAERLARGAERIKALKAQVAEFDEELKQSPDAKMRDKQAELSREQNNKLKEQFRAIEEIKI
jgi:hypothetical protein